MRVPTILIPSDSGSLGDWKYGEGELSLLLAEESCDTAGQWFYFQVLGLPEIEMLSVSISNADQSLYPKGWPEYSPVFSVNGQVWKKSSPIHIDTSGRANFRISEPPPEFFLAWYEPYPLARMRSFLGELSRRPNFEVRYPLEDFAFVSIGTPRDGTILIIARQHPGETMGSFLVEGLLEALSNSEPSAAFDRIQFLIFPMMNPRGVEMGKHRFSCEGIDFNRSWADINCPPEVRYVKDALGLSEKTCAFIDIHGDEVRRNAPNYLEPEPSSDAESSLAQKRLVRNITKTTVDLEVLGDSQSVFRTIGSKVLKHRAPKGIVGTATHFAKTSYGIPSITYEVRAHNTTSSDCRQLGKSLARALIEFVESAE